MVQISFVGKSKCSWKDCGETIEPNLVLFADNGKTLLKAARLVSQFTRFYCNSHMDEIQVKHKKRQLDKIKNIMENPQKNFQVKYKDGEY